MQGRINMSSLAGIEFTASLSAFGYFISTQQFYAKFTILLEYKFPRYFRIISDVF